MKRLATVLLFILAMLLCVVDVSAQTTIYWKRDHIYAGPGGGEIATVTPPPSDTSAPTTPTSLGISATTATSVSLSWTGSTDSGGSSLAGYKIYRQKGSGASLPVGTVNSSTTAFTDQPLEASTTYTWTIRAFDNAQNHSAASSSTSTTTSSASTDTTAPSAPPQLTARVLTSTSVQLNWLASTDAGGSGIAGYRVKRGGTDVSGWLSATTLAYLDNSAPQNSSITYTAEAKDGQGNISSASNSVNVTTPLDPTPPSTPGSPSASALTSTSIRVSWTASTDTGGSGLSGYKVYRNGTLISGSNPVTGTSFDHTGLSASTNYTNYTIKAIDGAGNLSAAAGPVSATTLADTIAPTTPGNLDGSWFDLGSGNWGVGLTWTASTDSGGSGLSGYNIYYVTTSGEYLLNTGGPVTDLYFEYEFGGSWNWEGFTGVLRVRAVDGASNLSSPASWSD